MKTWETLTMSRKEVPRAGLLKAALAGRISNAQGALALHLSLRQFQRVKVRFATEGARGLLHRLRGRPSPRRLAARSGADTRDERLVPLHAACREGAGLLRDRHAPVLMVRRVLSRRLRPPSPSTSMS